jgi:hypothetical protein
MNRPTLLRRSLLAALLIWAVSASEWPVADQLTWRIAGYLWQFDEGLPACERMTWVQKPQEYMEGLCGSANVLACAVGCVTFSAYSEREARRYHLNGETLYLHERRHVMERMSHPESMTTATREQQ